PRLLCLLVGEVDSDDPTRGADLRGCAEHVGSRAGAQVEHLLAGCERGEVEVIADARERRQGLGRNRIEQLVRITQLKRERPADRKVKLGLLLPRDLAVHLPNLRLEGVAVDERARVGLWGPATADRGTDRARALDELAARVARFGLALAKLLDP